ncbi:response regulator [uncultured Legionella sp.]|uniref:ATP-binding response regulator n=1 Tax=uncultured Legionella sp. TaxID=210934 RepID=UPI00262723CC|nr:response regulator [uncultured Legionella sp.]
MFWNHQKGNPENLKQVHQYYMDIMNCLPDIVYWVDVDCHLLGCNNRFVALLGLNELRDFKGTPYQQMEKFAHWNDKSIEMLKLDDMRAIFTGQSRYNVEEKPILDGNNNNLYFRTNRVPMFDENKNVVGLVVVLTDISANKKQIHSEQIQKKEAIKSELPAKITSLPSILMIEDNLIAQNVEKALLTALNCQVDIADTGDMALKLFDPGKYDLVLMDIGLEGTSGYIVAKQLRNMEKDTNHHVPIIALTGYEADVVKYDCEQYFMEGAITKPLTSEQAEQIIDHYVYHLDVPVRGLKSV